MSNVYLHIQLMFSYAHKCLVMIEQMFIYSYCEIEHDLTITHTSVSIKHIAVGLTVLNLSG